MSNFALNFNMFCDMIDQIIDYNKDFPQPSIFIKPLVEYLRL